MSEIIMALSADVNEENFEDILKDSVFIRVMDAFEDNLEF